MTSINGEVAREFSQAAPNDIITVFFSFNKAGREAEMTVPSGKFTVELSQIGFDPKCGKLLMWPFILMVNRHLRTVFSECYLMHGLEAAPLHIEYPDGENRMPPTEMLDLNATTLPQVPVPRRLVYILRPVEAP